MSIREVKIVLLLYFVLERIEVGHDYILDESGIVEEGEE